VDQRLPRRHSLVEATIHVDRLAVDAAAIETSDTRAAAVVRVILTALGFDEHRLLTLRLEQKWPAYRIFAERCGMPMPRTSALSVYVRASANPEELHRLLTADFGDDYVIKPVVGAGSGDNGTYDHRADLQMVFREPAGTVETHIVQESVRLLRELRIHTIEDRLMPGLTFPRYGRDAVDAKTLDAVERFAAGQLDALPNELIFDSLYGWDIAQTPAGWTVIEINPTGFHPVWCRGYQTTGFVQEGSDAIANLALLIDAIQTLYAVPIHLANDDAILISVTSLRRAG